MRRIVTDTAGALSIIDQFVVGMVIASGQIYSELEGIRLTEIPNLFRFEYGLGFRGLRIR